MKTYPILRLRWKLWGKFGYPWSPFGPKYRTWRVEIHKIRKGPFRGRWAYYNRVDGYGARLLLGFVTEMGLEDALAMAEHQALGMLEKPTATACPCSLYPDAPEGDPATRICSACQRRFIAPGLPQPSHDLQYSGNLQGIVCTCGWTSIEGDHTLHLPKAQGGTCADCIATHEAFEAHLATTRVEACECMKWKAASPGNYAAGICGKCNRTCWPGVPADSPEPEPAFVYEPFTDSGRKRIWPDDEDTQGGPPHSGQGDTRV